MDIEDAMQEIEVRALQRPPRGASRGAWACAVATNLAMDMHRRNARHGRDDAPARLRLETDEAEQVHLRDAVSRGLEALAPELRATAVLRFYADFSVPEIASAMAIPEGTVKSRLHRAVAELRVRLPVETLR